MKKQPNLNDLSAYFGNSDIEWKTIAYTKDGKRGLAVPYITNRAIMDRLDQACGPANWRNEFAQGPDGGVLCGISIRVDGEWVTKWDGAPNTDIESIKGGLSSSMRRAAVQWGVGRYLYRIPRRWEELDDRRRFKNSPNVPSNFLPGMSGDGFADPRLEPFVVVPNPRMKSQQRPQPRRQPQRMEAPPHRKAS